MSVAWVEENCDNCGLPMHGTVKDNRRKWEPYAPYWNPHTGQRTLCKPCFWMSLYGTEPPASWLPRDMGTGYAKAHA